MADFLLEIGSEELPSRFLKNEELELASRFKSALDEAGLGYEDIAVMSTPRRLTLKVTGLPVSQPLKEEIITGPPASIAFSKDGKPAKALEGFAKSCNVPVDEIFRIETEKGAYMAARKNTGGAPTNEILAQISPLVISSLPFAKRMRWGDGNFAYARPLRWILALLDSEVVPFEVGNIVSGRETYGHRTMGSGPFTVDCVNSWERIVKEKGAIVASAEQRKREIVLEGDALAKKLGGQIVWKDGLLEEVCGLVEHPVPLIGDFDPVFLQIPEEVLLTSMENHQKSFGIRGGDGKLLPHFLTVLNLVPKNMDIVKKGWERVLRARLEDARFFWESDRRQNFENWLQKLEHVIYIGPLGSMADKSRRLANLCAWLAEKTGAASVEDARRAGELAKADLVSGMVGEFDTLQGIMGGIYAALAGERPEVAKAIREQYLPAGPDSPLPATELGAILAIADKADTLAGCFGLNRIPTGMADPNGLRRCALGIIRILLDKKYDFPVNELFAKARELYGDKPWKLSAADAQSRLLEFFEGRLRNHFIQLGYNTLFVDATLKAGFRCVPKFAARLDALETFSRQDNFVAAAQTLKRVQNISKKSGDVLAGADNAENASLQWNENLLLENEEKALSANLQSLLPKLDAQLSGGEYAAALATLEKLRKPVDDFFDNVMVLCEDEQLRQNRLQLLSAISHRFARIADFSVLQI